MQLSLLMSLHDYIGDISTGVDACIMMGVLGRFLYLQMAGLVNLQMEPALLPNPYAYIIIQGTGPLLLPYQWQHPDSTLATSIVAGGYGALRPRLTTPQNQRSAHCCYKSNVASCHIPLNLEPSPPKEQACCLSKKECQRGHSAPPTWRAIIEPFSVFRRSSSTLMESLVEGNWG